MKKTVTFLQHKEATATDCESFAKFLTDLAASVRQGNIKAFEEFFIEGGTEEGDAKIQALREYAVLRFFARQEHLSDTVKAE